MIYRSRSHPRRIVEQKVPVIARIVQSSYRINYLRQRVISTHTRAIAAIRSGITLSNKVDSKSSCDPHEMHHTTAQVAMTTCWYLKHELALCDVLFLLPQNLQSLVKGTEGHQASSRVTDDSKWSSLKGARVHSVSHHRNCPLPSSSSSSSSDNQGLRRI